MGNVRRGKVFLQISRSSKNANSCLPVYARRRAATFDAHVPCNASNVFKVTTFSGSVKMTRICIYIRGTDYPVSTARDLHDRDHGIRVEIIDARFDTPVPHNGTVEMASTDQ